MKNLTQIINKYDDVLDLVKDIINNEYDDELLISEGIEHAGVVTSWGRTTIWPLSKSDGKDVPAEDLINIVFPKHIPESQRIVSHTLSKETEEQDIYGTTEDPVQIFRNKKDLIIFVGYSPK